MFCRKGATFSTPYRHKALTEKKVSRAGGGLHPNPFKTTQVSWPSLLPPDDSKIERGTLRQYPLVGCDEAQLSLLF